MISFLTSKFTLMFIILAHATYHAIDQFRWIEIDNLTNCSEFLFIKGQLMGHILKFS